MPFQTYLGGRPPRRSQGAPPCPPNCRPPYLSGRGGNRPCARRRKALGCRSRRARGRRALSVATAGRARLARIAQGFARRQPMVDRLRTALTNSCRLSCRRQPRPSRHMHGEAFEEVTRGFVELRLWIVLGWSVRPLGGSRLDGGKEIADAFPRCQHRVNTGSG
jgi:hypothetical protein